ncbi:hypothetical protein RJ639_015768 [Escallonia herrerae]|uniref:Uncharacterized protein n=1 Tax=Escallonia herrerae TaxID=1293975 RepID=A0AA88VDP0_9ASTE|nr:hypothetical protein RJ639_015768 [Escallonia herrerae]
MLNCLMYKLSYYRFVQTDGKAFDRERRTEIGRKYFKLTHFEEVRLTSLLMANLACWGCSSSITELHTLSTVHSFMSFY